MNKEYEYSFKVKSLKPFIEYCENNNYIKIEESKQLRTLYKKEDKTMARITIKDINGNISKELDFKDDIMSDDVLIERRESLPLSFSNDEAVYSIIDFLGYKKDKILDRTRVVYKKDNVKFEIDSYKSPEVMYVVAVEGEKNSTDKVYNEISSMFKSYIK